MLRAEGRRSSLFLSPRNVVSVSGGKTGCAGLSSDMAHAVIRRRREASMDSSRQWEAAKRIQRSVLTWLAIRWFSSAKLAAVRLRAVMRMVVSRHRLCASKLLALAGVAAARRSGPYSEALRFRAGSAVARAVKVKLDRGAWGRQRGALVCQRSWRCRSARVTAAKRRNAASRWVSCCDAPSFLCVLRLAAARVSVWSLFCC